MDEQIDKAKLVEWIESHKVNCKNSSTKSYIRYSHILAKINSGEFDCEVKEPDMTGASTVSANGLAGYVRKNSHADLKKAIEESNKELDCEAAKSELKPTEKYRFCNHHHEIDEHHEMVDFGDGKFVANKVAIPLLKALNQLGLRTRSHHIDDKEHAWVCILLEDVEIVVKDVFERDADRVKHNGKKELRIEWHKAESDCKGYMNQKNWINDGKPWEAK